MSRFINLCLASCFALMSFSPPSHADETSTGDLLKPVNLWADAFNRWDFAYPEGAFTEDAVVVDQFPPFLWKGRGAPRKWWADLMGATQKIHESRSYAKQKVVFEKPSFVQVKDDKAYFVMPATLTWTDKKGGAHTMKAQWVATEQRTKDGWRISSHSWAPTSETPPE